MSHGRVVKHKHNVLTMSLDWLHLNSMSCVDQWTTMPPKIIWLSGWIIWRDYCAGIRGKVVEPEKIYIVFDVDAVTVKVKPSTARKSQMSQRRSRTRTCIIRKRQETWKDSQEGKEAVKCAKCIYFYERNGLNYSRPFHCQPMRQCWFQLAP